MSYTLCLEGPADQGLVNAVLGDIVTELGRPSCVYAGDTLEHAVQVWCEGRQLAWAPFYGEAFDVWVGFGGAQQPTDPAPAAALVVEIDQRWPQIKPPLYKLVAVE